MPLQIIRDDIARVSADAIVNTADPRPVVGAGTDWAVNRAAGPELLEARRRIGPLRPGECAETPAFALHARYVLHTVSPAWEGGGKGEEALLRRSYDAALARAAALGCRSVAFPLLSAGSCGFPHAAALAVALRAMTDFLMEHEMQILLVLFDSRAFGLAGSIFDDLKSYVDDNYVGAKTAAERPRSARRCRRTRGELPAILPRREEAEPSGDFGATGPAAADAPDLESEPCPPLAASAPPRFAESFKDIFRHSENSFTEHLIELLRERGGKDSEVYKRAEVSKQLFSKILSNPAYQPSKSTAVQLAIGLELDLEQTQKLLGKAGYALTNSSKKDLVVKYCIDRRIYSVPFINAALNDCGLPPLKTGLKE